MSDEEALAGEAWLEDAAWSVERMVGGWWACEESAVRRSAAVGLDRREGAEDIEYNEARLRLDATVGAGGLEAVELIRALVHAVPEEMEHEEHADIPLTIAMEDLVCVRDGELADSIVDVAARDDRFAEVLARVEILDHSLDESAFATLAPWVPYLTERSIRRTRPRPKGRRWKEHGISHEDRPTSTE